MRRYFFKQVHHVLMLACAIIIMSAAFPQALMGQ